MSDAKKHGKQNNDVNVEHFSVQVKFKCNFLSKLSFLQCCMFFHFFCKNLLKTFVENPVEVNRKALIMFNLNYFVSYHDVLPSYLNIFCGSV